MKNNNTAIIRKITDRVLKANIKRDFFIIAAIALTGFMIASVFSVGMSYYESVYIFPFRSEGILTHMGFEQPSEEQLETLRNLDYVRHYSTAIHNVGMAEIPGIAHGLSMVAPDRASWEHFQTPALANIIGRFAEAENEIMLSRAKLEVMGIENPRIGMEIPLTFTIDGQNETQSKYFYLSAIYTEFVSTRPNSFTPVMVSMAFAENHGRIYQENLGVNVIFTNRGRAFEYAERLRDDLNFRPGQRFEMHPALIGSSEVNTATMYLAIGIIVAFLMFTGFLLIYNVMYVSVSKDVRFYGMLKTLGTTPRQLRRIVNGQVLRLYVIGLPIGLILAAVASFAVVPAFIAGGIPTGAIVSFSPVIFVGGAAFTLLTSYLGAFTSARKAARVSPIESIKYSGEQKVSFKLKRPSNGSPYRMAWRNVFRERKRALVVLISLFLGIAVFTAIMAIVSSMDIDGEINAWYDHDFAVSGGIGVLDEDFINRVAGIDGVVEISEMTQTFALYPGQMATSAVFGVDTSWLFAIDPTLAHTLDIDAFERGEIALVENRFLQFSDNPLYLYPGDVLDIEIGEARQPSRVEIAGSIHRITPLTGLGVGMGFGGLRRMPDLVMSNMYLRHNHEDVHVFHLGINVASGTDSQVNTALQSMMIQGNSAMNSRLDALRAMEEGRMIMTVLGASISAILALIGIFNFINSISVGLMVRKREFAALESVGMSKKQLRKMLRFEGAIYWMLTIALSLTLGTGIAYGLFMMIQNAGAIDMFPQFVYPALPILIAYAMVIIICSITPGLAYRSIGKLSLVERLREVE